MPLLRPAILLGLILTMGAPAGAQDPVSEPAQDPVVTESAAPSAAPENALAKAAEDAALPAVVDEPSAAEADAASGSTDAPSASEQAPVQIQPEAEAADSAAPAEGSAAERVTEAAHSSSPQDPASPATQSQASVADTSADAPAGTDPTTTDPNSTETEIPGAFGVLDPNRLNAFLDGMVEASMLQYHLPGVVVSVVEGDQLISSRGWGFADLEKRQLASPATSLFRVGSVSKVVTATALMQLVERGQLDLEQPVSRYLDPPPFPGADRVTVNHLLTHRAGFEDGYVGHFVADDAASDYTLEDYVARFAPAQVREPGQFSSYSNYSLATLGQIIATVSASPFESYVDDQLLAPLGMTHSSFREAAAQMPPRDDSLPAELAEQRAQGYRYSGGQQRPNTRWFMHRGMAPAGSLSATAEDMARFMRMHLNEGRIDGVQVLRAETVAKMHQELSRNHPEVGGNAHGFWANQISGLETLEHGGAVFNFYTNLVLIPEARIGIFVSTNGAEGRQFTQDLPRMVVEQFLASRAPVAPTLAGFAERAEPLTGTYRSTRRNYSKLEASGGLFDSDTTVSVIEPDTLLVSGSGPAQTYHEVQPGVYSADRDGKRIAFSSTADGQAQRLYPNYGHVVLERVPWYARTDLFWGVFGSLLLLSVLRIAGLRLRRPQPAGPASHSAAVIGYLAALGWVAFAITMMMVFDQLSEPESELLVHFPNQLANWSLGIGLGAAALSVLCVVLTPWVVGGQWPWWRRWHFALFSLAALLSLPLLWYWRLLGYHLYGTESVLLPPLIGG